MESVRTAFSSPRTSRILFWLGAAVLAAGVTFFIIKLADRGGSNTTAPAQVVQPQPSQNGAAQQKVNTKANLKDVDPAAITVAKEFLNTAVARRHLERSWALLHPTLRQGYTKKEWVSGSNAVVPFQFSKIDTSTWKVEWLTKRAVQIDLTLAPKPGSGETRATEFRIGLTKVGKGANAHWLVDYWMPAGAEGIPTTPSG